MQVVSFLRTRAFVLLSTRFCRARYDLFDIFFSRRSDQVREQHSSPPVIVIGAGIVGTATAAFLAMAGTPVRLLDASAPASGATGAADGAVSVASKRPGPMMTMARAGAALYRELAGQGLFQGLFHKRPTFLVAASDAEADVLSDHSKALGEVGAPVRWLTRDGAADRLPSLTRKVVAVLEVEDEGHAIGYSIVSRLISAARLKVERYCPVASLEYEGRSGRVSGVRVGGAVIEAPAVVVAAGGGAGRLIGLPDVSRPRRGQQLVTERAPGLNAALPGSLLSCSYLLSKKHEGEKADARGYGVVIDPLETGQFLIGSTREEGRTIPENDIEAVAHLAASAQEMVPALGQLRILRCFAGIRTATCDGLPMIGRMPGTENLFVAAGFEGDGICLGPLTGRIMADLVRGEEPEMDVSPFDPGRFATGSIAA
ncbi:FAD-dependent oxidoreductase [Sinorhizobium medicae]|nr:FAD-dependent oxidoreductase [Sinorhizobium medicae]MDX0891620.1 FAD-dependent oxidoreductase [Sinorhizobium medicae]MDX1124391.1 FAD-dependent oxidoreductase [Sinorhizobium medicae]MDX1227313.1 FAD-dependent oxidoreductase [Sinorhizobium medicae]